MNKSIATHETVDSFLTTLDQKRRHDSEVLIDRMQKITGESPVLWGADIIGFDTYHYYSESGREGDIPVLSFSPRPETLVLYISQGFDELDEFLDALGPHTTSAGCLYIEQLEDIDMRVLEKLLKRTYAVMTGNPEEEETIDSVDDYINAFDEPQRRHLTTIRETIKMLAPAATEKISYQIAAFELNGKILLYYGGFNDHVSIYPVPAGLENELKPYLRGKGTIWFPLERPLPTMLIKKIARAHIARQNQPR